MKKSANLNQSQYGLYVDCISHQGEIYYNLPYLYKLDGSLDGERLRKAIETAVEAHPVLFTRIEQGADGEPLQTLDRENEKWTLEIENIKNIEAEKKVMVKPFDIVGGRLFNIRLLKDADNYYYFGDIHHLVNDGTSAEILLHDIEKAYKGEALEPEALSLIEQAEYEAQKRETPEYEEAKKWYAANYDCGDTYSFIAQDLEEAEPKDGDLLRPLGIDLGEIEAFCKKSGIFKSTFFTGAYAFTLAKFCGDEESLFNTVYNGRDDKRLAGSLGMFVKTIPVYAKFDDKTTVAAFLSAIQEQMTGARENSIYSYSDVIHDLGLQTGSDFAWHGDIFGDRLFAGKPMEMETVGGETRISKLYVKAFLLGKEVQLEAEYNANEYSEELIGEILKSYCETVKGFLSKKNLSEIEIAGEDQIKTLDSFNENDVDYDNSETVVSAFRAQAAKTPNKTALVFKEKQFSFKEIDDISDRIATFLSSKGLGHEDVVSIIIPRSEWMQIAPLGVLKAGCSYQPLDPTYPEERLNFMMKDADAKFLIADEQLRPLLTEYKGETLLTKDIAKLPKKEAPEVKISPEDLMVLLYTSGSTGVPKGCQLLHSNIVAFCHMYIDQVSLDTESKISAYASFGFDAHVMEIFSPLFVGAELHIIPEEIRLDLMALNEYFNRKGITHTFMTTQVAYQFATGGIDNHSLKHFVTGGEKLASLVPPKSFTLYNAYGPTETICFVTCYPVTEERQNIPIGKAVENTRCYIVDKEGHRQPVGAAGELWVSGPQVSRGYLNRPDKTAEVFIPNPFTTDEKYASAYRTGDIVRYLPDGNIQFVGRKDGMVKIRGFRIELKEVEGIIRQFPGIKDATVQAFDEENGSGKFIAAYIVSDDKVDIEALNSFIMEEKPPYMVPAVTMQIDSIPLNQNQKVNKKALPKPEKTAIQGSASSGAATPMNLLEEEIMGIVSGIVGSKDFDISTVLGYVGLTSISSIKLAVQINKRFGVSLPAKELVKSGTIQSIENEILKSLLQGGAEGASKEPAKENQLLVPRTSPLSAPQQGVYVDCMKNPASTIYNIPMKITLPEGIDEKKVDAALRSFVKIHPEMTICFGSEGAEVVQTTNPGLDFEIPVTEMSEKELDTYKTDFVKPFKLTEAPLFRFEIVKTPKALYLLSDLHHLIADGASYDLFLRSLCLLLEGKEPEDEQMTYADFIEAEKKADKSGAKEFFHSQLKDVEGPTELTPDLTNPRRDGVTGSVSAPIEWKGVESFCKKNGVTPAHLLLSSVIYTLSRYSNSPDVTLVTISNGRSNLAIYNTMGMFVNTLALHAKATEGKVLDFIKEEGRIFDGTLKYENYPFATIAADYDLSAEIMFAYQIGVIDRYHIGDKSLETESLELNVPKFPIAFYITEQNGKPSVLVEYDNGKYSEGVMGQMAESVVNVVKAFIEGPEKPLSGVSLLNDAQLKTLESFNDNAVEFDSKESIVSLFRKQVKAHANKVAVIYEDKRFTYKDVDKITDRIAGHLLSNGVKKGDVVSVIIPRSEWMPIASLGILKAGCAYQPLDPSYPEERLNFMMKDASAKMLIADEDLRKKVADYKGKVLFTKDIANLPDAALPKGSEPSPDDLFILLYTSGSTGTPKGCRWVHRNMVAFCHWYQRRFSLTAENKVSAYASYGFDACQMDMYAALTGGAASCIVPESIRLDLPRLASFFESEGITHAFMTTQIAYQFATTQKCKTLKYLLTGGEKLAAIAPPENYALINIYGPTECTVCITTYEVDDNLIDIPVGKPTDNMSLYIVDTDGHRLPVGAAGELWAAGPQVCDGYLNRPEKTAETFIENPFGEGKVYRTGDIVRYQSDGNIQFVGRRDGQVKIRGFRIETKEVEAVIREFPGIKDATVQAFDYENGGKYLAAYIVSDEGKVDIKKLNSFIAERKPSYMVPAATMQLDAIPLNQNQKVNRKALPAPEINSLSRDYVAPDNELEKLFCEIFQNILSTDKVGATDSFFDLGGTSLMVTRVIIEADKAGHHVAYGDIFSHPTPRQLSRFLGGGGADVSNEERGDKGEDQTITHYDYSSIHKLLEGNTLEAFRKGKKQKMSSVLLTGSTGYLGIHILHELILSEEVKTICCMVRGKDETDAKRRLQTLLFYYFESNFDDLFESGRLRIVVGDVTRDIAEAVGDLDKDSPIDIVFNCAAIVKHFSKGTEIEDVNVGGAKACVKFCLEKGARLIHVSTYSTGGINLGNLPEDTVLTEQKLYYGQDLDNAYVHSKFLSERIVLEAMVENGLNAKIVRLGNLAPRSTDGEFQINFQTNSAMGRVRAYKIVGGYSYEESDQPMEFSPINEVARSVVLLSSTPLECCLFHPFNNHYVYFGDVMNELRVIGDAPKQMEAEEFVKNMTAAKADPKKAQLLTGLLAYQDLGHGEKASMVPPSNIYTTQVLYRLGFRWSVTSWDYVDKFLTAISRLGYFKVK